jgi:hypothetical protein
LKSEKAVGILLPVQFLPIIRRRWLGLHKVVGRVCFVSIFVGNIGMSVNFNEGNLS